MRLSRLSLTTFRNLTTLEINVPQATGGQIKKGQIIALVGQNGSGKTSVLEALSLLSPGRGLHKAKPEDMVQHGQKQWGVFAELEDATEIGQSCQGKTRKLKIDGTESPTQAALAQYGSVIWLTPRQDRLFLDGAAARRDVLDRCVYGQNPSHAETVARYKHHAGARLKLLKQGQSADWIEIEEQQAADWGIKVLQNRAGYIQTLAPHLQEISLELTGATLQVLEDADPVAALKGKFERSRERDAEVGITHTGPQKIDLTATLHVEDRNIPAAQASSGQHKRVLMQFILAHVRLLTAEKGTPPLILMDEVSAHLDTQKRSHLLATLTTLGAQIWVTETELERLGEVVPDVVIELPQA